MRVGFLGCGNMGGALAAAVARCEGHRILLCDLDQGKAASLRDRIGENAEICDISALSDCDALFLGVKPNGAKEALVSLGEGFCGLIISMVAGMQTKTVAQVAKDARIIRIMPNTPASVGDGMILYSLGATATEEDGEALCSLLAKAGELCRLDEELIDKATAISGCGPAFVFSFMEAMIEGGLSIGLSYELSRRLAAQTVLGAASYLKQSDRTPDELCTAVCSPGGSTIEGVKKLREHDLKATVIDAVNASYEKTVKLGKG